MSRTVLLALLVLSAASCRITRPPDIPVSSDSVDPGGEVTFFGGNPHALVGTPLAVGDPLPDVTLLDSLTMQEVELAGLKGRVLVLSVVPAIDTAVCTQQTLQVGKGALGLPGDVLVITISRDTPADQKRFAETSELTHLTYLSDHPDAPFGTAAGLIVGELEFLARAIIVVDRDGVVSYMQVVPEIGHLPDLEEAFLKARELAAKP